MFLWVAEHGNRTSRREIDVMRGRHGWSILLGTPTSLRGRHYARDLHPHAEMAEVSDLLNLVESSNQNPKESRKEVHIERH